MVGVKEDKPAPKKKRKRTPKKIIEAKKFLEEINKPTKGDELIEKIKKEEEKQKDKKEEISQNKNDDYASLITKDGVEVVDVKIVPKKEEDKPRTDKFGIPIIEPRKTWDKI